MLSRIRGGVGLGVGWFDNNVCRVVGGGGTTFFWTDNWWTVFLYGRDFLAFLI